MNMGEEIYEKKIKGLMAFITSMQRHYIGGIKGLFPENNLAPVDETTLRKMAARINGLEADLRTLGNAVGKIAMISNKNDYKGVLKIIKEDLYIDGFETYR